MGRGLAFTDAHRVLLMLILENYPHLTWSEAADVFNIVFSQENRTRHTLEQAWWHRNNDQQEEWEHAWDEPRAGHEPEIRNQWLQAIAGALEKLKISPTTKTTRHNTRWTYDMRLVLHLLQQDGSLNPDKRTRIINAIFQEYLTNNRFPTITATSLQSQLTQRNRQATAVARGEKSMKLKPAQAQWQRILERLSTEDDHADAAKWEKKIEKQRAILRSAPDQGLSRKSQEDEGEVDNEQEVQEEVHEHEPQGIQGEPSFNPNEGVGSWHFGAWGDWHQARLNLGGQLTGMPARPTAEDIRRLRQQMRRQERLDTWTQGINIYPGAETVDWTRVDPNVLCRSQQRGQGGNSLEPAHRKNREDSVSATATGDIGGDMDNDGVKAAAEEAVTEGNMQECGLGDDPEAGKDSRDRLAPLQNSLLMQEEINNHLLRSNPEHAVEVRRLFEPLNRSTRTLLMLAACLARVRETLRKHKNP